MNTTASQPVARRTWLWPGAIIALIAMNACIVGATLYFALSDRSVSIEPDYYAQALKYEDVVRLRADMARLGWTVEADAARQGTGAEATLSVRMRTREGTPLDGAQVQAIAFPNVRAGDRQALTLAPREGAPGAYVAKLHAPFGGRWHVRVTILRGPDHYFHECELDLPATPMSAD